MSEDKKPERPLRREHHTEFEAVLASQILSGVPGVLGVELFGRTARKGVGNDLDLILRVSLEDAQKFRDAMWMEKIRTPEVRFKAACKVLGQPFKDAVDMMKRERAKSKFDFLLLEEGWRELMKHWHIGSYQELLQAIDKDARRLA